jgi:hypothetical protein
VNKQPLIRFLQGTTIAALLTVFLVGALQRDFSYAAAGLAPQAEPAQPVGTDWDAEAPPPDDPLDSSMPLPSAGRPSQNPPVFVEAPERPVRAAHASAPNAPAIDLWYGQNQTFGELGNPQAQINLLGNVTGTFPVSLMYALNGGVAQSLNIGPDTKRLADPGDFNIAITRTALITGLNEVVITATDALSVTTVVTANVTYFDDRTWPQSYNITWPLVTDIQEVAQVVDGHWEVSNKGLRPLQLDYDRLVAIGDASWQDYEVTVPVFIRGIDPSGFDKPSNGPGIGLIANWQGHTLMPGETPPATGWRTQLGALAWYRWGRQNTHTTELLGTGGGAIATNSVKELSFNVQYVMKLSVQRQPGAPSYYRFKIWRADEPEPAIWDLQGPGKANGPVSGSLLLVAHHVDATFGNVVVTPLSQIQPTLLVGTQGNGTVTIMPDQTQYEYGDTVRLAATGGSGSFFNGWSGDITSSNNPLVFNITQDTDLTANFSVTPTTPISSTVVSDDFNSCTLGEDWEFINPLGDGTVSLNGTRVLLTVPQGVSHNVFNQGIPAPRIMQAVEDTDFEVIVKFESSVNRRYQVQGIIVEQDVDDNEEDFIRFDFFHDGSNVRIYALSVQDGSPVERINEIITPVGTASYLKVRREGNVWTEAYSFDGESFTNFNFSLTNPLTVNKVGVFAGNHGNNPTVVPAHTAIVDYFFNNAAPISPEDGTPTTLAMTVTPEASGTVTITSPPKTSFTCGETVTLQATPADGYKFTGWSGAAVGTTNPVTLTYDLGDAVTATFEKDSLDLYLPLVRRDR